MRTRESVNPLRVTDLTFRDGHQSLFATRVRTEDLTSVAPEIGVAPHNAAPWRFARTAARLQDPPPATLGRDNEYVFRDLLGLTAERRRRLGESGIAGRTPPPSNPLPEPSPVEQKRTGAIVDHDPNFRERISALVARLQQQR